MTMSQETTLAPLRTELLEASGLIQGESVVNMEHLKIDPATVAIHRIIAYDTGVVPYRVEFASPHTDRDVYLMVDRSELIREGFDPEDTTEFIKAAEEPLLQRIVQVDVVDFGTDF